MSQPTKHNSDSGSTAPGDSVQLEIVATERSKNMGPAEKRHMILNNVKDGKVVILEEGLSPEESSKLVEQAMGQIDHTKEDGFTGIEIETYPNHSQASTGVLDRLVNWNSDDQHLAIVGPADKVETLEKQDDLLSTLVHSA